jgi:hypothetical protein
MDNGRFNSELTISCTKKLQTQLFPRRPRNRCILINVQDLAVGRVKVGITMSIFKAYELHREHVVKVKCK